MSEVALSRMTAALVCAFVGVLAGCAASPTCALPSASSVSGAETAALAEQVEIRRTAHGVPHVLAENLKAAAFGLAYVQAEDYGERVLREMIAARGRMSLVDGDADVDIDLRNRRRYARAVETFHLLGQDTRDVYEGFAAGLNHYVRAHRDALPDRIESDFVAYDVFARDIDWPSRSAMDRFRRIVEDGNEPPVLDARNAVVVNDGGMVEPRSGGIIEADDQNVGSNAWALAPSRTTSGHAILLRNPHLSWDAGYYEAHLRVPGKLDFYGDFRVGGPFTMISGFNAQLGFATTDNAPRTYAFYAFHADPDRPNHILLDGASVPLHRELTTVAVRAGAGIRCATEEIWTSPLGPVVHRADGLVYIYRFAMDGVFRAGEQWLEMMKARDLAEWKEAMRIQALPMSNFTYADRAGNIFYVWNAAAPLMPHPSGGDTLAIPATRTDQVWTRIAPFDSLPQLLNPPGGYVHNENDSPHFTNMNVVLDHDRFSFWVQKPSLRLRSQHAIELLHNDRIFSLEDVVEAKHSMRMLLADRVKPDLLAAIRASEPGRASIRAIEVLEDWDNTVSAESRGGVLFKVWWGRYSRLLGANEPFGVPWSVEQPTTTPRGLADPARAVEAFELAVEQMRRRYGGWDVAWGDVHRVRRGDVDVPVGGCGGSLGCIRVLGFERAADWKRVVSGGDGWILAVEFSDPPRAYSVLAYGPSPDPASPFHASQAAMFAANRMKPVAWTEADIERTLVSRYRPGEEQTENPDSP